MSAPGAIIGVDVGGTFTDFFWFDAAARRFVTAKAPSHRGTRPSAFSRACAGWA